MPDGNSPVAETTPAPFVPGGVQTFACPNCGGSIHIRAVGITINAVCQSCGSLIDTTNENLSIITAAAVKLRQSAITIGTRGVLFDVEWEVIGYTVREDQHGMFGWREYLLFNPYQGFRFLTESDGHWNFVIMLRQNVANPGSIALYNEESYRNFDKGAAKVVYVMGEFYWRVKVGDQLTYFADYVRPPYSLSKEVSPDEVVWSRGIYVQPQVIAEAFKLMHMPSREGVGPNQPGPFEGKTKDINKVAGLFVAALVVAQVIASMAGHRQVIYQRQATVPPIYRNQLMLSDPITIPGGRGNVEIAAYSPVSNNWVELDVSLTNDATQESDDLIIPIEYYSGYDSDGSWSEGGQKTTTIISSVRGGDYHLLVEPDAGAFQQNQPIDLSIMVTRNVSMWDNFWAALLLVMVWPAFVIGRRWHFETQRWNNKDDAGDTRIGIDND